VTPCHDTASQSLHGSVDLGHHGSTLGDRFPYHCESGRFQWFDPEDGPGDDPDDPRDGDNNNDNDNDEFVDAPEELDPGLAVFHNLAIAVNRLSHSSHQTNESSSCAKVREPDTFNSTDHKKLRTFLVQCELCFQDRAKAFCLDRAKVTFTQSYLKGMTLEWFELDLLNSRDPADHPRWMDSWVHFIAELQSTFGPHDPIAEPRYAVHRGLQLPHLPSPGLWRWHAPPPVLLPTSGSSERRDCSSRQTSDSPWTPGTVPGDQCVLLGAQR